MKKYGSWLKGLSTVKKVLLGIGVITILGAANSSHSTTLNSSTPSTTTDTSQSQLQVKPKAAVKADEVVVKTETQTKDVPYATTNVNVSSLPKGQTEILTHGLNGVETITYKVTYTNGAETDRQQISDNLTIAPTNEVIGNGTYVAPAPQPSCPNGTYVNTYGNTVCSPYQSSSAPAGATAQCLDGTYSFSQSHSGTCSHHGGVSSWL